MSDAEQTGGVSGEGLLEHAIARHQANDLEAAERCYLELLTAEPDHPDALHFLGVLQHQKGDSDRALALIGRSLELAPGYHDARNNRGNILKECNRIEAAEADYRQVLEAVPWHADAASNLGVVLRGMGRNHAALEAFQQSLEHRPDDGRTLVNFGWLLWSMDREVPAVEALRRAVEVDPDFDQAYRRLGLVLLEAGRRAEAIEVFRQWLDRQPGNPVAAHMFAAVQDGEVPERCSDDFVVSVFDSFARTFDDVLGQLDYQAPNLVREAFDRHLPPGERLSRLCDAGCGTGLCGMQLRDRADILEGVDLSAGMLAKAARRRVYDRLHRYELVQFFRDADRPFDAIVCADTLNYFGNLEPPLRAAAGAMVEGGLLVFTLEQLQDTESSGGDYQVEASGRYSHRREHVEAILERTGWSTLEVRSSALRMELGQPVEGMVITARRSRTAAGAQ